MKLSEVLIAKIGLSNNFISITGSGGKTTLLKLLASCYKNLNKSVLITTTTKIQSPKLFDFNQDRSFFDEKDVLIHEPVKGEIVFYSLRHIMDPKKCVAPPIEVLNVLSRRYDVVLCEADGAKGLPLKLHTERDPVVLPITSATIAVMGASSLGLKGDNVCFGLDSPKIVDFSFFQDLIDDEEGVLKAMRGKKFLLINQADLLKEEDIKKLSLLKLPQDVELIICSEEKDVVYE